MDISVVVGLLVVFIGISVVVGNVVGLSGWSEHLIDSVNSFGCKGNVDFYGSPVLTSHYSPQGEQ